MYKIGLTGGIASGKSTVLNWLKKKGISFIDADVIAREIVLPGQPGLKTLVETFGARILNEDGTLCREELGRIIFSSKHRREKVNKIMHTLIKQRMEELANQYEREGVKAIVYDIPLLIETGWYKYMDENWLVYVDKETQIDRLKNRNGLTEIEALQRIRCQMELASKRIYVQEIIDNTGTEESLERQLDVLWSQKKFLFQ